MDEATRAQIISILNEVDDMTIVTVRKDGYPEDQLPASPRRALAEILQR